MKFRLVVMQKNIVCHSRMSDRGLQIIASKHQHHPAWMDGGCGGVVMQGWLLSCGLHIINVSLTETLRLRLCCSSLSHRQ